MPSFHAKRWFQRRLAAGVPDASGEDGFLLIEVIISALLVGFIVVGTLTGFGVANRATANERNHNEAAVLAAESQEQLRSESAIGLHELAEAESSYKRTVGGTIFTITQKASPGNGAGQTGCVSAETGGKGKGVYFLISSTVKWENMVGKPVVESSIVTPPTGSALEVEVGNGQVPTAGVTVSVAYTPTESTGTTTLEGTTGAQGCVLFAGLPTTSALVEVKETKGIVNAHGTLSWPTKTVTLAPNIVTPDPVELAPAGALEALFRFNKSTGTTYSHKNNANTKEISELVTGDTFVVSNPKMGVEPFFETGGNSPLAKFGPSGLYEMLLVSPVGKYFKEAFSPKEFTSNYPNGNLFPFPTASEGKWTAYAGDCTANNPKTQGITPPSAAVTGGVTSPVEVPMAYDQLEVFQGTSATPGSLETTNPALVTITNKGCKGVTPNNGTELDITHTQETTTGTEWGGHLQAPFQPFGEFELCLLAEPSPTTKPGVKHTYKFKEAYVNKSATEKLVSKIYLGESSSQEVEAVRAKSESETEKKRVEKEAAARAPLVTKEEETKSKREATEATTRKTAETKEAETRSKREATEATTRKTAETKENEAQSKREATEATTRASAEAVEVANQKKWKEEKEKNKITESQRTAKLATQTTERTNREKSEATAKKNEETKENETQSKREATEASTRKTEETKEATTKSTREKTEETARKTAEGTEATTRTTREKTEEMTRKTEEAKEETTRKTAETAEKATLAARAVVVETKSSC
jgi:type II secretory pathway pseudopilin PulG